MKNKAFTPYLFFVRNFIKKLEFKQKNANHRKGAGFTLIEFLVVIVVISLMVAIVIINIQNPQAKAHDVNIKRFMHQLRNTAQFSYNQIGSYKDVCDETDNTLSNTGDFGFLEDALEDEHPGEQVACFESADKESFAAFFPLRDSSKIIKTTKILPF